MLQAIARRKSRPPNSPSWLTIGLFREFWNMDGVCMSAPRGSRRNFYNWHDGRKNWDTMTAVFDYRPLDDDAKGFQVVYSSRKTNSAGVAAIQMGQKITFDDAKQQVVVGGRS